MDRSIKIEQKINENMDMKRKMKMKRKRRVTKEITIKRSIYQIEDIEKIKR